MGIMQFSELIVLSREHSSSTVIKSFRFIKKLLNIVGLEKDERKLILALVRKDKDIAKFNPDQSV